MNVCVSVLILNKKKTRITTIHVHVKGVRALRGYFGPPMRQKNENCFSQVSSY